MADYLELCFQSPILQKQMVGVGTGLQHIHLTDLRKDMIPMCPLKEQLGIVNRARQLPDFSNHIEQQIKDAQSRINNLTQSILSKAFSGNLTAEWRAENPDLITGENSARALLDRIKAEQAKLKPARRGRKKKAAST